MPSRYLLPLLLVGWVACSSDDDNKPTVDARVVDARVVDAPRVVDQAVGVDTSPDMAVDAGPDVAVDAAVDLGPDLAPDLTLDLGADLGSDATDAGPTEPPLSGLKLWLKADEGITKDANDRVSAWANQAADENHLAQSTQSMQPLAVTSTWGQVVRFDSNDRLLVGSVLGIAADSGRTLVAVSRSIDQTRHYILAQGNLATNWAYVAIDANTYQSANDSFGVYLSSNAIDGETVIHYDPAIHVLVINTMVASTPVLPTSGTPTIEYYLDGVLQSLSLRAGTTTVSDFTTADSTFLGGPAGAFEVAELLLYDHPLSTADRTALQAYLVQRHGL